MSVPAIPQSPAPSAAPAARSSVVPKSRPAAADRRREDRARVALVQTWMRRLSAPH